MPYMNKTNLTAGLAAAVTTSTRYRLSLIREEEVPYGGERPYADRPSSTVGLLRAILRDEPFEVFGALLLSTKMQCDGHVVLYRGTLNRAAVEPRGVLCAALLANASAVVLFHNHPSGDPGPSPEDFAMTRRIVQAGALVGVRVVDHVVLGEDRHVSLQGTRPDLFDA
jgi:DNA repair protein RadC